MKNELLFLGSLTAVALGCSSGASVGAPTADGGSGGRDGAVGSGTGATDGVTGGALGMGGDRYLPDGAFPYDPSKDTDPADCVKESRGADRIPVDMFVMLDRTGSMTHPYPTDHPDGYCDVDEPDWESIGSKWCNAINSFAGFLRAPSSVGLGVALSEFQGRPPVAQCGANTVMDVPFGIIANDDSNGVIARVVTEMNDDDPSSTTPTEYAVNTLIARTSAWKSSSENTRDVPIVAIIITDGFPSSDCPTDDIGTLNQRMRAHFQSQGIPFCLVGMDGIRAQDMEGLAEGAGAAVHSDFCVSGDTECSYYSVGGGDPNTFVAALDQIRKAVIGCSFAVPSTGAGLVNLDTAEVVFTPEIGAPSSEVRRVANLASCTSGLEYYVKGDTIELCPQACENVGPSSSVKLDIKCEGN